MTNVQHIVDRAAGRGTTGNSTNGGPPAAGDGTRLAIAAAIAFVVGVVVARWLDWRTHAHPHH
jgi:hypothetical protein